MSLRNHTLELEKKKSSVQPANVLVISLDFDGCLFNRDYCLSDKPDRLIQCNQRLFKHLLSEINSGFYDKVIFMVGSNRQSYGVDRVNSNSVKGSCFPALLTFCSEIQRFTQIPCTVDPFLMSDLYGNKAPGTNFNAAINGAKEGYDSYVWDSCKYSLLYTQLHKKAADFPKSNVYFQFYDDKHETILPALAKFTSHQSLMPRNLKKLRLFHYDYEHLSEYPNDNNKHFGKGIIDFEYYDNVKTMAEFAGYYAEKGHFDISAGLNTTHLKLFHKLRKLQPVEVVLTIKSLINQYAAKNPDQELLQLFITLQKSLSREFKSRLKTESASLIMSSETGILAKRMCDLIYDLEAGRSSNHRIKKIIKEYGVKGNIDHADNFLFKNRPPLGLFSIVHAQNPLQNAKQLAAYFETKQNFGMELSSTPKLGC